MSPKKLNARQPFAPLTPSPVSNEGGNEKKRSHSDRDQLSPKKLSSGSKFFRVPRPGKIRDQQPLRTESTATTLTTPRPLRSEYIPRLAADVEVANAELGSPSTRQSVGTQSEALRLQPASLCDIQEVAVKLDNGLVKWVLSSDLVIYVDDKPLGSGSFAHVFAAIDEAGQLFAVKCSLSQRLSPTKRRLRVTPDALLREYRLLQRMGLITPQDIFRRKDEVFWLMPLAAGTLAHLQKSMETVTHELARYTAGQILASLVPLHRLNMAHGDLKRDNILIYEDMTIAVTDLGCASEFDKAPQGDLGDFNYLAPELHISRVCNSATDMWAVGLTIWELAANCTNPLTGLQRAYGDWHARQPRDANGRIRPAEVSTQMSSGEDAPWAHTLSQLPEDLADLILNDLVHPDPKARATAAALKARLPAAFHNLPEPARRTLLEALPQLPGVQARQRLQNLMEGQANTNLGSPQRSTYEPLDDDASFHTP